MSRHSTNWIARQKAAAALKPTAHITDMRVRRRRGRTTVTIIGQQLSPSLSPARITIDGVVLAKPQYDPSTKCITGELPVTVPGRHVVIDKGFYRMEWRRRRLWDELVYLGEEIVRIVVAAFRRG